MSHRIRYLATVLAGIGVFVSTGVQAQSVLEEVVVTAQKRAESLQDVPIAISAFTGDNLKDFGVNTAEEVMALIPNGGIILKAI